MKNVLLENGLMATLFFGGRDDRVGEGDAKSDQDDAAGGKEEHLLASGGGHHHIPAPDGIIAGKACLFPYFFPIFYPFLPYFRTPAICARDPILLFSCFVHVRLGAIQTK